MPEWELRFEPGSIRSWAGRYAYGDDSAILEAGRRAQAAREFSHADFLLVCKWKSPRSQSKCSRNSSSEVVEITKIALTTQIEHLRIGVLRCLHGVDWPTASVLLHIAHPDPYPILDVRALWSLGFDKKPNYYTFDLWMRYVQVCRQIATSQGVDMRTLDRAMWQYSKEHQGSL
ncbi:MAG: hypothetical protein CMJ19_12370 [Phycisphaeraceae bacterium]|nr:hypothetical protein [Phycisphaeraceae bacterium]